MFVKLQNDFFSIIADDIFELIINDDHTFSKKTNLHAIDIHDFIKEKLNGKAQLSKFNKNQITILIEYLCNNGVFLDFDQKNKAVIASIFNGHSEQNLRTEGFASKDQILSGNNSSKKNDSSYYLKIVQDLLEAILADLKQRIQ